jgi:hypothetical protein
VTNRIQGFFFLLCLRLSRCASRGTKLSKFASSRVARRILGQPRSTLDLREVVRTGKLLLVSTASGVVGADLSELIGIVLLGLFEAALAEQAIVPFSGAGATWC